MESAMKKWGNGIKNEWLEEGIMYAVLGNQRNPLEEKNFWTETGMVKKTQTGDLGGRRGKASRE